ncbi:hydroxylamine reductase [Caminicella sporogenes DSM 14501]|uniref:Hydroxylamine reductase n=1 Tax=Caminicella sporogenes DSM 14501 TaxID=1121266 RepID=A0A1M6SM48_9FIRM|nr:hydroxylamine reductase [Caminicella sporogenes]RKD26538.1 hydroxylamine reductase [Caminicella sporogenes]WIF95373.1 hydroxylamine reductase [Caminicella sporogenes]SHK45717.1 hydroxylamine reductase [Caminicella sporogenes DSM 14501]
MDNQMFCFQCEQALGGKGCVKFGVCGKSPEVAGLQDLLVHLLKGIGFYGQKVLQQGKTIDENTHKFVMDAIFATLTNVNFDPERFVEYIKKAYEIKEQLKKLAGDIESEIPEAAKYIPPDTKEEMLKDAKKVGVMADKNLDEDIRSLRELLIYALKGMGAYAHHAYILGKTDDTVNNFFYKALASVLDDNLTVDDLVKLNLELGQVNFKCMELLDSANTGAYGHPVPTEVLITKKKGPFIIVSGHDLKDLKELLEQTEGKGINIYTHCEMLPAHAYPELKKYPHLIGNYGGAWQDQQKEFDGIPGAILMTTNCIQKPRDSYKDRIFTTSIVGWPDIAHIEEVNGKKDFTPIIEKALELGGWQEDEEEKKILIGFGHNTVLGVADKIIEAVKSGKIRHFFLIGGCDGAKPGRNYYTEFAEKAPKDTVILTLACGKYRFNKKEFGTIGELPRLLDIGQCNDAYSAIKIAIALAEAFECDINELPLSLILSWYEQKAVCILLTLLSLGLKNIRLGPSLPAFISPNVLQVLVDNFNLKPISNAEADLAEILG